MATTDHADELAGFRLESLNPLRRCACEEHTGHERWHGQRKGYAYHRCDCPDCKYAIRQYYASPGRQAARKAENCRRGNARRARKYGAPHEDYEPLDIAERDEWTCGICAKSISGTARWPSPGSLSIDHILPLSRGGSDIKSNVQAAHLRCNMRKSAKVER